MKSSISRISALSFGECLCLGLSLATVRFRCSSIPVLYNKHMLGVDKLDQLVSYYSFVHKSVKWWRKVFFWWLEVAVVNSCVVYKIECDKNKTQALVHLAYTVAN